MTREEAMTAYRALVVRYGMQWTPRNVPDQWAWDRMEEVNKVLTTEDRREALGLPPIPAGDRYPLRVALWSCSTQGLACWWVWAV